MTSFHAQCAVVAAVQALVLAQAPGAGRAAEPITPGLFPLPAPAAYPTYTLAQAAPRYSAWQEYTQPPRRPFEPDPSDFQPSPSDILPSPSEILPPERSVIPPHEGLDLSGGWAEYPGYPDGHGQLPSLSDPGCGKFLYANALILTPIASGNLVTSAHSGTGQAAIVMGEQFDNVWHGGFEIGGGWCFGCDRSQGLEVVYWGLFAAPGTVTAAGTLDSPIDFSQLDYGGGPADAFFQGAAAHRLVFDQGFHSVEINVLGNYAGPLGCGRGGCCNPCHRSKLSFGWLAGFRYLNFTEDWLLTADAAEAVFDGDATELGYEVDLDNNLFGFQMGLGLDYCLTPRFQTYAVAKFGVYGNAIDHRQQVSGVLGNATLNAGPQAGSDYVIDDSDFDLALAGQLDFGGRCAISRRWSVDFGYRLVGLSGVATAEDNVAQASFQTLAAGPITDSSGSLILHGAYAGATCTW